MGGVSEYVGCDVQMLCRVTMHNYSSEILSNDVMVFVTFDLYVKLERECCSLVDRVNKDTKKY